MEIKISIFVIVSLAVTCLISATHAAQGKAVYYPPPYTPSKCFGNQNNGVMVAGVRDELWDNGKACGRSYRVKCIGGANTAPHPCKPGTSVVVKVVDYCRPVCNGILNLSQDAFSKIADTNAGVVTVEYNPA